MIEPLPLPGLVAIVGVRHDDPRGSFAETYGEPPG